MSFLFSSRDVNLHSLDLIILHFLRILAGNLVTFSSGAACGWCGPNFIVLTQDTTPLPAGPLTVSEGSLVVSLLAVGALIGTVVNSMYLDRYGRKILLAFMAIGQIVCIRSWRFFGATIIFVTNFIIFSDVFPSR